MAALAISALPLAAQEAVSPYRQAAIEIANWLDSVAICDHECLRWPTVPDESDQTVHHLYSGTAGIVLFHLELYRATGKRQYLDKAIAGAYAMAAYVESPIPEIDWGLFTGLPGMGYVLRQVEDEAKDDRITRGARRVLDQIKSQARRTKQNHRDASSWNDVTDLIGGSAGIGFYLLDEYRRQRDPEVLALAIATGDGLLAVAAPTSLDGRNGLKWWMSPTFPREMPNMSHGTAGVCWYLTMLDQVCKTELAAESGYDSRFLKGAEQGAAYLMALSQQSPEGLIPHHFPGGEHLYYLGWCHGPAGTIRLFDELYRATRNEQYRLTADRLNTALLLAGLPRRREGFWENISVCCGNCGIIAMCLERSQSFAGNKEMAQLLVDDLLSRATRMALGEGRYGLCWVQCEHRVRPELKQAQTGLMQGAAGVGITLLAFDAHESSQPRRKILPPLPF